MKNKSDFFFENLNLYFTYCFYLFNLFFFNSWSPRIRDVNPFDFDTYHEYQDFHGGHFGPFSIKMSTYRFFFSYLNNSTHKDHFCMFTHISPRYNIWPKTSNLRITVGHCRSLEVIRNHWPSHKLGKIKQAMDYLFLFIWYTSRTVSSYIKIQ